MPINKSFVDHHQPPSMPNKKDDKRVSVCRLCSKGIFEQHNYRWTGTGYLHKECEEREATK